MSSGVNDIHIADMDFDRKFGENDRSDKDNYIDDNYYADGNDADMEPFRSYDEVCIDIESIFGSLSKEVKSFLEEMTPKSKKELFRRVSAID